MPDLVVVDGGVGQYNAVINILHTMYGLIDLKNKDISLVSVIKDDRHKPKGFHGPEEVIKKYKKEILLANSESHRFAIGYHKKLRGKDFLK